jgi:hypothetical protein
MYIENPYLRPPRVAGPKSRSWGQGFSYGFQGPEYSSIPTTDIHPEDADAFDEGVLAGQNASIDGIDLAQPCVNLNARRDNVFLALAVDEVQLGGEAAINLTNYLFNLPVKLSLAGGILSGVMFLIDLSVALQTFSDDPETALQNGANRLQQQLHELGFGAPLELFIAGGFDLLQTGCELRLTGIHRHEETAVSAAQQLGRSQWFVAAWRSDQSGGAKIVNWSY